jgi:hypothetical protein
MVYAGGVSTAYLWQTGARLPLAEYDRRWPHHPTLKCYLDWGCVTDEWGEVPPPLSSADV